MDKLQKRGPKNTRPKLVRSDKKYWKRRAEIGAEILIQQERSRGNYKYIPTPAIMWELACDYFERVDESPIKKQEFIRGGDNAGKKIDIEYARPYSWAGFEDYLFERGIIAYLDEYRFRTKPGYDNYAEVMNQIGKIMHANKFDGAAVGIFNAVIVARDLGLADKIIQENLNANIELDIDYSKLSDEALEEITRLLDEAKDGKPKRLMP